MKSYLSHLECTGCGKSHSHAQAIRICPDCGKVLFARYDLVSLKVELEPSFFQRRVGKMWRFYELLPVIEQGNVVSLGEGGTPLLHLHNLGKCLSLKNLYLKDEGMNPTGTFKARGLSVAVSKAKEVGQMRVSMPNGNAGAAMAAYAARGGLKSHVFMHKNSLVANQKEIKIVGSNLTLVGGPLGEPGRIAQEKAEEEGLFDLSTLREPYRVEGKKTMALEIAMDLGWRAPDVIIYPTGGGTGIVGMWKAFQELQELGWIDTAQPRFIAVQPEGCQPIVKAFKEGSQRAEPWLNASTIAYGLLVPSPFGDYIILRVLRETGGAALAVTDSEIVAAIRELAASEGVFACPEGAASLAGLKRLLRQGYFNEDETIVLMNTGSGLKYLDLMNGA